jgi:subfamily B ATP-binding cassette protein MsbA
MDHHGQDRLRGELGGKEALRRLGAYLLPLWKLVLIGLVLTVAHSALNLGYGKLLKDLVDLAQKQVQFGSKDLGTINQYVLVALGVFVLKAVLYFGMSYSWAYAGQKLSLRLRNEVFAHLQRMCISFFDHQKTGQLMSVLSNDVGLAVSVLDTIQDSLQAPIMVIGGIIVLFVLNWRLALISCLCLPPMVWMIARAYRKMTAYTGQLQGFRALVTDASQETISSMRTVQSFGNEEHEIRRFYGRSNNIFRTALRTMRLRLTMRQIVELLGALAIILVLWVGVIEIVRHPGKMTFGALAWFVLVLQQVSSSARDVGNIAVSLSSVGVAADRVFSLLNIKSDIKEKPEAIELGEVQGRITFEGVGFAYSSGIPVLKDISFVMEPGEVAALVGPTGAGKTTIAALIPRLYDVTAGAIRVDGTDLRDCTLKSLRKQIGIVPQDTALFAGTLRENIAYGRLDAKEEEIIAAAKMANAWEFIEKLPDGLNARIGERGVMLSGGQRQRIAIARAVLRDPRILILDEATSSLDAQSEALIQDALQKLVADRTTLVIAHRLSTIRNADKILVIKEGQIVEMGRHAELLAHGGVYSDLYRTQFRWEEAGDRRSPLE